MKYCVYCGSEIADEAVICLKCGCRTQNTNSFASFRGAEESKRAEQREIDSQLATWSKISGIVSFFIGGFVLGITAIILANLSKDDTNGTMCSSAKVGYVCGIISTVLTFILLVAVIAFMTAFAL